MMIDVGQHERRTSQLWNTTPWNIHLFPSITFFHHWIETFFILSDVPTMIPPSCLVFECIALYFICVILAQVLIGFVMRLNYL